MAVGAATYLYGIFSPTSQLFGRLILRAPDDCGNKVAITFDDGPTRGGTTPILDILDRMNCPATFFFIGHNVEQCPDLVRRASAAGHQIENHSFDHARLGVFCRGEYWKRQWQRTDAAIAAAGGPARTRYFRPPMGFKTWRITMAAKSSGLHMIGWSLRGMDGVPTSSAAIVRRIVPKARAGDIIALHDGHEPHIKRDALATAEALPRIIQSLRDRGLEPVRLDALLENVPPRATSDAARAATSA